jgi:hypothetical protein
VTSADTVGGGPYEDGDVSDEKDVLPFTVKNSKGQTIECKALETEEHSGGFVGRIFPVAWTTAKFHVGTTFPVCAYQSGEMYPCGP